MNKNIELTEEIIEKIKAENEGKAIFKRNISNQDYVFTYISRSEYKEIQDWIEANPKVLPSDIDDKILSYGLLWPQVMPYEWTAKPAGVVPTLSRLIQEKSALDPMGTGDIDGLLTDVITNFDPVVGPTEEEIKGLIKSCPHPLKLVKVCGKAFVIRPILRPEYTALQKLPDNVDAEIEGCNRCILWPKSVSWDNLCAGIPATISREIMLLSGFSGNQDTVEL